MTTTTTTTVDLANEVLAAEYANSAKWANRRGGYSHASFDGDDICQQAAVAFIELANEGRFDGLSYDSLRNAWRGLVKKTGWLMYRSVSVEKERNIAHLERKPGRTPFTAQVEAREILEIAYAQSRGLLAWLLEDGDLKSFAEATGRTIYDVRTYSAIARAKAFSLCRN